MVGYLSAYRGALSAFFSFYTPQTLFFSRAVPLLLLRKLDICTVKGARSRQTAPTNSFSYFLQYKKRLAMYLQHTPFVQYTSSAPLPPRIHKQSSPPPPPPFSYNLHFLFRPPVQSISPLSTPSRGGEASLMFTRIFTAAVPTLHNSRFVFCFSNEKNTLIT